MKLPNNLEDQLLRIIIAGDMIKPGPLVRKDGFVVPVYPDFRRILAMRQFIQLFPKLVRSALKDAPPFDVACGIESAGVALAYEVARTMNVDFAYIRKKPKSYSLKRLIEGDLAGKRVLLVDDTLFYGQTKEHAMREIAKAGGLFQGIFVIFTVDPQAHDWAKGKKVKLWGLLSFDEALEQAVRDGVMSQSLYDLNHTIYRARDWQHWHKNQKLWEQFQALQEKDSLFQKSK